MGKLKWWLGTAVLIAVFGAFYVVDVVTIRVTRAPRSPGGFAGPGARRA